MWGFLWGWGGGGPRRVPPQTAGGGRGLKGGGGELKGLAVFCRCVLVRQRREKERACERVSKQATKPPRAGKEKCIF